MERAQIKAMAKSQIKGNVGTLFLISLVAALVSAAANIIPVVGSLAMAFVITPAFTIATVIIYLNMTAGVEPTVSELFNHFGKFWAAFKVTFLQGLFVILWSLLFYIPGIVKSYLCTSRPRILKSALWKPFPVPSR